MSSPELDRVVETYVRICPQSEALQNRHLAVLRGVIAPSLASLRSAGLVDWFCFLIHGTANGVPAELGADDVYWHLRIAPPPTLRVSSLVEAIQPPFEGTRVADPAVLRNVSFPSPNLLRNDALTVWQLLGAQSEWLLNVLDAYGDASDEDVREGVAQFLHYFFNMTQTPIS